MGSMERQEQPLGGHRRPDDAENLAIELARREPLERMMAMVRLRPEDVALDLGTGKGNTAIAVAPWVARVIAVDLDDAVLEKTSAAVRERNLEGRIEIRQVDATKPLPLPDESVAVVTCRAAFQHFADGAAALAEVERVLPARADGSTWVRLFCDDRAASRNKPARRWDAGSGPARKGNERRAGSASGAVAL